MQTRDQLFFREKLKYNFSDFGYLYVSYYDIVTHCVFIVCNLLIKRSFAKYNSRNCVCLRQRSLDFTFSIGVTLSLKKHVLSRERSIRARSKRYSPVRARANGLTRNGNARRKSGAFSSGTRHAERANPARSRGRGRAIPRSVMKIPGCIDMHLQDSDCARRAPGVHFARFQDFPAESRKSEFFTIARTHHQCHPAAITLSPPWVPRPTSSPSLMHLERDGIHFAGAIFQDKFWSRLSSSSPSAASCFSPANSR